jgi:hypothetical protein
MGPQGSSGVHAMLLGTGVTHLAVPESAAPFPQATTCPPLQVTPQGAGVMSQLEPVQACMSRSAANKASTA